MTLSELKRILDYSKAGLEMYELVQTLYPICRSITGNGVRETLAVIEQEIPLETREVPSGTPVFDWTVPKEWNIRDAYVKSSRGERVIDFRASNLHVVNYSVPVRARMSLSELKEHLHSLPEHPHWVPYRTSYYAEKWGFCISHSDLLALPEDTYEVVIDSSLEQGHLTYGESFFKGISSEEVLLSCHICHPSLCNDNLSGIALQTALGKILASVSHHYSYRLLYIPGTIGSITWLSMNEANVGRIRHGLVLAGVGDQGHVTYKKSRRGDADIDRAMEHVLGKSGTPYTVEPFSPYGYDERQYGSPGFNLPVGCFQRTPFGRYPEYHTSADDLGFVQPESLTDSLQKCVAVLDVLENNRKFVGTNPKCEPQLGKRGLYGAVGGRSDASFNQLALLWALNLADGDHDLLDTAEESGMDFDTIRNAAEALLKVGLLNEKI